MVARIRWEELRKESASDLLDDLSDHRDSAVEVIDSSDGGPNELLGPITVMLVVLVGTVAVGKLAQVVTAYTCRREKRGLIIDARGEELDIRPQEHLPGGTVILFAKDGSTKTIDVCEGDVDLDGTIAALLGGASASDAVNPDA